MGLGKRLSRFARVQAKYWVNPAKGNRTYAQDNPTSKAVPLLGKAAGLFTWGIGEKVAQHGFQADIKAGRVHGMGPNAPTPLSAPEIGMQQAAQSRPMAPRYSHAGAPMRRRRMPARKTKRRMPARRYRR